MALAAGVSSANSQQPCGGGDNAGEEGLDHGLGINGKVYVPYVFFPFNNSRSLQRTDVYDVQLFFSILLVIRPSVFYG